MGATGTRLVARLGARLRAMIGRVRVTLIGRSASLPAELARDWPELRDARYRRGGVPPRVGGWCLGERTVAAITLGRTVWLAEESEWDIALLLHELGHVHQFAATRGFPFRYVWESVRRGYRANRFEVDARAFAARRLQGSAAPPLSEDV